MVKMGGKPREGMEGKEGWVDRGGKDRDGRIGKEREQGEDRREAKMRKREGEKG